MSCLALSGNSQDPPAKADPKVRDAAADATRPTGRPGDRPEGRPTEHDKSDVFAPTKAMPISPALKAQPKGGKLAGFDFARDPLNSDRPMTPASEVMKAETGPVDAELVERTGSGGSTRSTAPGAGMTGSRPT